MSERDLASSESVSTDTVERLFVDGYLSREAYERARSLVWPATKLRRWVEWGLLLGGAGFVLVGIGYWFAYSWGALPRLGKLGLIEVAFGAFAATASIRGLDDSIGEFGLLGACVSVGGFLLVLGMVYPTGAENWRLFGGWAVLTVGFVVVGRSQLLWVFWIGLVDAAAASYCLETSIASTEVGFSLASAGIGLYTLLAGALAELLREVTDTGWLGPIWSRWVLLGTGLAFVSVPVWMYVGLGWAATSWVPLGVFGLWVAVVVGLYLYFRRVRFDLAALTLLGLVTVSTPTVRWVVGVHRWSSLAIALLAGGVGVLVGSAALVQWLIGLDASNSGGTSR